MSASGKILNKIKEEKIKPISRWKFIAKDCFVWSGLGLSILIGSLSVSVIIFLLTDNDWDIYKNLEKSFGEYIILSFPYLWIVVLGAFLGISYLNYKHTKKGYRHNPLLITSLGILASIILGSIFFYSGLGLKIDRIFSNNFSHYETMLHYRKNFWMNPERGLLAGRIISVNSSDEFQVRDLRREDWKIEGEGIIWRGDAVPQEGRVVKIIGNKKEGNIFIAKEVRPWSGKGRAQMQNGGHGTNKGRK